MPSNRKELNLVMKQYSTLNLLPFYYLKPEDTPLPKVLGKGYSQLLVCSHNFFNVTANNFEAYYTVFAVTVYSVHDCNVFPLISGENVTATEFESPTLIPT